MKNPSFEKTIVWTRFDNYLGNNSLPTTSHLTIPIAEHANCIYIQNLFKENDTIAALIYRGDMPKH